MNQKKKCQNVSPVWMLKRKYSSHMLHIEVSYQESLNNHVVMCYASLVSYNISRLQGKVWRRWSTRSNHLSFTAITRPQLVVSYTDMWKVFRHMRLNIYIYIHYNADFPYCKYSYTCVVKWLQPNITRDFRQIRSYRAFVRQWDSSTVLMLNTIGKVTFCVSIWSIIQALPKAI